MAKKNLSRMECQSEKCHKSFFTYYLKDVRGCPYCGHAAGEYSGAFVYHLTTARRAADAVKAEV